MINYIISGRVAFFAILLLSATACSGQESPTILPLSKKYIYENTDPENFKRVPSFGMNTFVTEDSLHNYVLPDSSATASVIELGIGVILPNDHYLSLFKNQYGHTYPLYLKRIGQEQVEVIVDCNYNRNFNDEKRDTLMVNKGGLFELDLYFDTSSNIIFPILLMLNVNTSAQKISQIALKTLLKYELSYTVEKDTLNLDILANCWFLNFYYTAEGERKKKLYRLDEPFPFARKWWKLQHLNLLEETIELVELDPKKMYGYREGLYADMSTIRSLTDANMMGKYKVDWQEKEYFLLHFWGDWCGPCVAEIPQTKDLMQALEKNPAVEFIHYPVVIRDSTAQKVKNFIIKNDLFLPHQSVVMANSSYACPMEKRVEEKCTVASVLRNDSYPEYILLDKNGRILYRGENNSSLHDKLRQYQLLE